MNRQQKDVPPEVSGLVTEAETALREIIPWAAEGDLGKSFLAIHGVLFKLGEIGKALFASDDRFAAQHEATERVLALIDADGAAADVAAGDAREGK